MSGRMERFAHAKRVMVFLFVFALVAAGAGCHWGQTAGPPYPPPEEVASRIPVDEKECGCPCCSEEELAEEPPEGMDSDEFLGKEPMESSGFPLATGPAEPETAASAPQDNAVAPPPSEKAVASPSPSTEQAKPPARHHAINRGKQIAPADTSASAMRPPAVTTAEEPGWARGREELVYRVEFLGITMGYARFSFKGKVSLDGKETYHLNVRAWTSDFLSVIYPINETIDYYMDVKSLEPLRVEYTGNPKKKDDVAFYDQKKGKIVYRYKQSGEIRKEVDLIPSVFDPVTVAYYFRARDLGEEERPRNVYGGRKLYQISSRLLGRERIETSRGHLDTVVIQPIIKLDGKLDNKGDLKMWMTSEPRHVPVRIYAKFKKIKMWTLYAELVPPKEGG